MSVRPKLKPFAYALILLLSGALAAANYYIFVNAPFGECSLGRVPPDADMSQMTQALGMLPVCINYGYYFIGAPLVVGLLLLLILPR
jgi:hypothetical protein